MKHFKSVSLLARVLLITFIVSGLVGVAIQPSLSARSTAGTRATPNHGLKSRTTLLELAHWGIALRDSHVCVRKDGPSAIIWEVSLLSGDNGHMPQLPYTTGHNSWLGIRPLMSSRVDVERLLGSPTNSLGQTVIYEYKTYKVHVLYSRSACEATEVGKWDVPSGIVLKFKVYPQNTVLVKDMKLAKAKYLRAKDVHPENWIHYINQFEGITIDAQIRGGREEVMSLVYEPSSSQKTLHCATQSKAQTAQRIKTSRRATTKALGRNFRRRPYEK